MKKKTKQLLKTGRVVSRVDKKTVKVLITYRKMIKKYQKSKKIDKIYLVDDQDNLAKVGDQVEIREVRPISRLKRFRIHSIFEDKNASAKKVSKKVKQ